MMVMASELASGFVEQSLGFTSQESKLNALHQIQSSLHSCFLGDGDAPSTAIDDDAAEVQQQRRQEWREFLEGPQSAGKGDDGYDEFDYDGKDSDFMLRDSLIKCLVESCHPSDENNDGQQDNNEDENINLIESSFICLTYLVRMRCVEGSNDSGMKRKASKKSSVAPMFGPEFVTTIATDVVEALKLDDGSSSSSSGVPTAAAELIIALLRSDRPRNEMSIPTIHDSIMLPACAADSPIGSVACIAEVFSTSIIAAVEHAVPATDDMDEEELSMRRETAALNRLQDMRDVMMNVGLRCSQGLMSQENDVPIITSNEKILSAIQQIYDIAAFAVESQLETLLDEKATPILSRLSKESTNQAENMGVAGVMKDYDDDSFADGSVSNSEEACTIAPLYSKIAKPPAILTTVKNLESMLVEITESLKTTDALWDERLDALIDLECVLAGGVASMSHEACYLFIEKLRKMPLEEQFNDLRSQITQQVCKVIIATAYEYRDFVMEDAQLNSTVLNFVECIVPAILNLCKSGTRLMATQGMNCLTSLMCVCGSIGYSRTIPRFCEEILGKKVHKNRKKGSVMALTAALRVWDSRCFVKHIDQLTKATKEGATNKDPAVREEGRKLYWAMHVSCPETSYAVENMFDGRSLKTLNNEREGIDLEWEEEGVMSVLVQTGVLGQAPEEPVQKKVTTKPKPRAPVSKGVPPRNSIKRPAGARLRAQHGTPFKSQRVDTPMKSASASGASSSSKKPPPPSAKSHTTPGVAYSPITFSAKTSINRSNISSSKIPRARPSPAPTKSVVDGGINSMYLPSAGKENSVAMRTPTKAVGFSAAASPLMGTPVVNLLARASPLSAEKIMNTSDILGEITYMLSDRLSPHEQSLGIKALALFAKEDPSHPSWEREFPLVLNCLLDHIKNMPTADFNGPVDFIRSPSKNLSDCHQMQHLFLQGVRSLLQFVPGYVKDDQIKDIVCCMLACTNEAPFEIVHTAERALHNLVTAANPETCFECLLSFTSVHIDLNDKSNPAVLLSTLRTIRQLIDRVSIDSLRNALPSLQPLFHTLLCHKSVDMRKATVFIIVEIHFVMEDELVLDEFTDCQRRLVDVYIERHAKQSQMMVESVPKPSTQLISA